MKRETADVASSIVDRINNLETTILELQNITNKSSYEIVAYENKMLIPIRVKLEEYSTAKEVFVQDILEYYINTLNLELDELKTELENLN